MIRVLLTHPTSSFERYFGPAAFAALSKFAYVERHNSEQPLTTPALIERAQGFQVILSERATAAPPALFAELPDLCAFVRCAVDIRTVDVEAASRHGVLVTHASAGFISAVTEWTLGAMIDLARGISRSSEIYHRGATPAAEMGLQLNGATLGIIGLGAIGSRLANLAVQLGMKVLAHDPYATTDHDGVERVEFSTVLTQADIVVCLAIANEKTENMFDARAFSQMKSGAYFINPSRGNLVDETALANALAQGRLAGAALDVGRAGDQMPTPALAAMDSVLATPHVGGLTPPAVAHQAFETVRQIEALAAGKIPEGAVNTAFATRLASVSKNNR